MTCWAASKAIAITIHAHSFGMSVAETGFGPSAAGCENPDSISRVEQQNRPFVMARDEIPTMIRSFCDSTDWCDANTEREQIAATTD